MKRRRIKAKNTPLLWLIIKVAFPIFMMFFVIGTLELINEENIRQSEQMEEEARDEGYRGEESFTVKEFFQGETDDGMVVYYFKGDREDDTLELFFPESLKVNTDIDRNDNVKIYFTNDILGYIEYENKDIPLIDCYGIVKTDQFFSEETEDEIIEVVMGLCITLSLVALVRGIRRRKVYKVSKQAVRSYKFDFSDPSIL